MSLAEDTTLVIIPTYNEKENIKAMLETIFALHPAISLLVIDDNSPDHTAQIVKDKQKQFPNLNLLSRAKKEGLGRAYEAGFRWALAQNLTYVITMDADFSHDPHDLKKLLTALQAGAAVAVGSRYIDGIRIINWPFKRLLISYGGSIYTRLITGMPILDTNGGMNGYHRQALAYLAQTKIKAHGYAFQIEVKYRLWSKGFKVQEVPITFTERRQGTSKMSGHIIKEALLTIPYLRWLKFCHRLEPDNQAKNS